MTQTRTAGAKSIELRPVDWLTIGLNGFTILAFGVLCIGLCVAIGVIDVSREQYDALDVCDPSWLVVPACFTGFLAGVRNLRKGYNFLAVVVLAIALLFSIPVVGASFDWFGSFLTPNAPRGHLQ